MLRKVCAGVALGLLAMSLAACNNSDTGGD